VKTHLIAAAVAALATAAQANSFTNGDFSSNNGAGQINYGTVVHGWYVPNSGLIALYADGTLDTVAAPTNRYQYGSLEMWGSKNGGNMVIPTSPSGAWDIVMDGDYEVERLSQDITGLQIGKTYTVGFNYAYAQQEGFYGDTDQSISVNLGSDSANEQSTPTLTNPSQNFTGWYTTHFNFKATSAAETLSFLAHGNLPIPPFAVISGVTFTPDAVPEPAAWAMMLIGVAGMGGIARRRRSADALAA
jgi:hypothetical protein